MCLSVHPWYFPLRYIKSPLPPFQSRPHSGPAPPFSLSLVSWLTPWSFHLIQEAQNPLRVEEGSGAEELGDDHLVFHCVKGCGHHTLIHCLFILPLQQHELLFNQPAQQTTAL